MLFSSVPSVLEFYSTTARLVSKADEFDPLIEFNGTNIYYKLGANHSGSDEKPSVFSFGIELELITKISFIISNQRNLPPFLNGSTENDVILETESHPSNNPGHSLGLKQLSNPSYSLSAIEEANNIQIHGKKEKEDSGSPSTKTPDPRRFLDPSFLILLRSKCTFERIQDFEQLIFSMLQLGAFFSSSIDRIDIVSSISSWIQQLTTIAKNNISNYSSTLVYQERLCSALNGFIRGSHLCWVLDGNLIDIIGPIRDLQKMLDPNGSVFILTSVTLAVDTDTQSSSGGSGKAVLNHSILPSSATIDKISAASVDITLPCLDEFIKTFSAISCSFLDVHIINGGGTLQFNGDHTTCTLKKFDQYSDQIWSDVSKSIHVKTDSLRNGDFDGSGDLDNVQPTISPIPHEVSMLSMNSPNGAGGLFRNQFDEGDVTFFKEIVGIMEGIPFDPNCALSVHLIKARVLSSLVLFFAAKYSLFEQTETIKSLLQEPCKNLDFILVCIEGLCILAIHDVTLIKDVVDFLVDFLLQPSSVFKVGLAEDRAGIIQECAANGLANLLDCPNFPPELVSLKKSTLFSCINCMHSSYSQITTISKKSADSVRGSRGLETDGLTSSEIPARRFANSASMISHLARVLKPKETIDIAIPAIIRRIEESNGLHATLWTALGNIGMNNDSEIFKSIISASLSYVGSSPHVSKILVLLARMPGRPLSLLQLYFEKVLITFHEKSLFLHKNSDNSVLPHLLQLTNILRVLLENQHLCEFVHANYDLSQQLRNVWFYLALFVLLPSGSWPNEWKSVLKGFARKCPAIVIDPQSRNIEVHLGSDSILVTTFNDQVTNKIKPLLCNFAPSKINEIRLLSWPVAVLLLTICEVESLRIKNLPIEYLCGYLVDDRLQTPQLYPVTESLIDGIFKIALKDSHYRELSSSIIEGHLKSLLLFAAHRITTIRLFAAKWIINILNVLPFMLFNRTIFHFMLDLLRFLDNSKIGHYEEHLDSFSGKINFLTTMEAHESASSFYLLCNDWVSSALQMSSAETIPILQSYISEISAIAPWIGSRQMEQSLGASPQDDVSSSFLMYLFQRFYADAATSASMIRHSNKRVRLLGEVRGLAESGLCNNHGKSLSFWKLSNQFAKELKAIYRDPESPHFLAQLYQSMSKCAALVILNDTVETELVMLICNAPKIHFVTSVVEITLEILSWIMSVKPSFVNRILAYLTQTWESIAMKGLGIYTADARSINPFEGPMTYGSPREMPGKEWSCESHAIWINFLLERFKFDRLQGNECLYLYFSFIKSACQDTFSMSSSFKAREARIDLCILSIKVAKELSRRGLKTSLFLWTDVFGFCCQLFSKPHIYGEMNQAHFSKMLLLYNSIKQLKFEKLGLSLTTTLLKSAFVTFKESDRLEFTDVQQLLILLWEHEIHRFSSWLKPLASDESSFGYTFPPALNERTIKWGAIVKIAWRINHEVAISLRSRFVNSIDLIDLELLDIAKTSYIRALSSSDVVSVFVRSTAKTKSENQLRHLLYWKPVAPVTAIQILSQTQNPHPLVIQFAIRSLEDFPITLVFFYIPQLVQALRSDSMGYIEKYILEAAKSSQYFAHQIIWNMDANKFKDDSCEIADSLKPTFDRIIQKIVNNLTGEDKAFYEREFSFFREITDISGKLKPLVVASASKQEKKKKIDEELAKIKVDVGVYLPTNPDRDVVDIDYQSGRPLQSHAKAPFIATFMVCNTGDHHAMPERMSSIFKVGDDCRQDVLALQLISVFQSIFQSSGLDLYTFPYRVVATAPGCGVIEVIPQSISRDMMGREKVNSLFDWFLAEFGSENSIKFKTARHEFIKSLAAYSIIMFLLQIKDRHNGNIMFDRQGHLIHIDFGFMLSIAPGGGILEVAPFKLTSEMIQVLGGDANSPGYILFSELCVKGYLACRLYAEEIVSIVQQMLESGLPCFKGELTIRRLRERFQLDKSERAAADFMISCIRQSHENTRSGLYDLFQYAQNGIPYK